ncbi:MAG: NUDIX hydrolase [Mycobacteriales bacterium]|nr:NUDIX domain-containing protein [Frankia sp.]
MEVVRRTAARVLLVDDQDRVLLFRGRDPARPDDGYWWFTPGGGLEPGESPADGARREVAEETGIVLTDLAGPVLQRDCEFDFLNRHLVVHEVYYCARVPGGAVDVSGFANYEAETIDQHRWWSRDELRVTDEVVFPEGLADVVGGWLGAAEVASAPP